MFEERLKKLLKKEGLTMEQLGQKIGLTGSAISMMIIGKRKPSYESLEALCKILKTTPNYLMGYEDEITEQERAILKTFAAFTSNSQNESQAQNTPQQTKAPEKER